MTLRTYLPTDCQALADLFYQTVHTVNARDYTPEQLNAWATGHADIHEWNRSLSSHYTVVATENDLIIGFGDIHPNGYLDRLYVHKDYQRQGVATAICDELERSFQGKTITTHASITAMPFFLSRGYQVLRQQQVIRQGIPLTNYIMILQQTTKK